MAKKKTKKRVVKKSTPKKKAGKKIVKKSKKSAPKRKKVKKIKIRRDCTIATLRKKYGIDLRGYNGKRLRSDTKLGTITVKNKKKK